MSEPPLRRIVSWNTKVGRGDDVIVRAVRNLIDDLDPDVLCLQECMGYTDALRAEFGVRNGGKWEVLCHRDWDEANANPVLVHERYAQNKRGKPNGWDTLRTHKTWTGPQGGDHEGRTWTWAKVAGVYVMSFHRATGMLKNNKDAGREEANTVERWVNERADEPVVIIGDHNVSPKKAEPAWTSRAIAERVEGMVRFDEDDPGIDYAITHRVKPKRVERRGSYGSDHEAVLFVMDS